MIGLKSIFFFSFLLVLTLSGSSQIVQLGFTVGPQQSWLRPDSGSFRDSVSVSPMTGIRAGAAIAFKVRNRNFLHTEYVYSVKGRVYKGKIDEFLKDEVKSRYFEITTLFTMQFKGHLVEGRDFKYYVGVGPSANYWISAAGSIYTSDLDENNYGILDYKVKFGPREFPGNTLYANDVYYPDANRWQWGINLGGGLMIEPGRSKIMLDFRYTIDHTWLGNGSADFFNPIDYDDNLKARYRSFRFSLIYLFEANLSKQLRHKGKSTIKK